MILYEYLLYVKYLFSALFLLSLGINVPANMNLLVDNSEDFVSGFCVQIRNNKIGNEWGGV